MAGTRSGRSASRKSTPLSPPRQDRVEPIPDTHRSTRQRLDSVGSSNTRASRDLSVASDASIGSRTRRKKNTAIAPLATLPPVTEASDVELLSTESPDLRAAHEDETGGDDSDGASAITSLSHREDMCSGLKALAVDSEQILDFLRPKDFSNIAVNQSFQRPDSRTSAKLEKLFSRLRDSCEPFGESDDLIPIALRPAVQRLVEAGHWQEVGPGRWRPDAVFQLANLATFAATVLGPNAKSSCDFGVLQTMWEQFPRPFTYGFEQSTAESLRYGYSKLLRSTFEVGLELRTQFAIALLAERMSDQNFDPDVVLNKVFYVENDDGYTQFLGFTAEGLCAEDRYLPVAFEQDVVERIQAIQQHFSEHSDGSVDITSLRASFPWEEFLAQAMSWLQSRAAELIQQIDGQGGVNSIQADLQMKASLQGNPKPTEISGNQARSARRPEEELGNPNDVPSLSLPALPTTTGPKKARPARKSVGEEAKRLKQLQEQIAQKSFHTEFERDQGTLPEGEIAETHPVGDDFEPPSGSALEMLLRDKSVNKEIVAKVYTTVERQQIQSNKENIDTRPRTKTFLDRQIGAEKVIFDDDPQRVFSGHKRRSNESPSKRHHDEGDDEDENEDDENDEFEATDPVAADGRRRELRKKTDVRMAGRRSLSKRPRSEIPESVRSVRDRKDGADHDLDEQAAVSQQLANGMANASPIPPSQQLPPSTQPTRDPPRSSQDSQTKHSASPSAPSSTARHLEYVRRRARDTVVRVKARPVQSRSAYTEAEEERLVALIEEYGTSYSLIKQMDEECAGGPLLRDRTQVQIKDKALELKFQSLKAGAPLHENFDKIPLRKRMREQLEALGIHRGY